MLEEAFARNMIPVVAIAGGLLMIIMTTLINNWRHVCISRANAELKQTMLDKGMNAEEIVKVLEAGGGKQKCL
jgi:hypothetical protein